MECLRELIVQCITGRLVTYFILGAVFAALGFLVNEYMDPAFASLTDRFSIFQIKIDTDKCSGCMKCATACPFCAIDIKTIQDKKGHPEITCAKCGECIKACPNKAISYDFRFNLKKGACNCGSKSSAPKTKFGRIIQELLHPAQLFRFAAFTFSVIMSSDFMIKSLNIIFSPLASLISGGAK